MRTAEVVPPPVDVTWLTPNDDVEREGFFLFVGRLVPVKRAELAIEAAGRAAVPLVVVGDGRLRGRLEAEAGPTVQFVGTGDRASSSTCTDGAAPSCSRVLSPSGSCRSKLRRAEHP